MKSLVIGGGISGLFLSYYLLEAGSDVALVDAAKGPVRTSAYNAGQLSSRPSFTDIFARSDIVRISASERRRNRAWFGLARRQKRDAYEQVAAALSTRSLALYEEFFAREKARVDLTGRVLDLHTDSPRRRTGGRPWGAVPDPEGTLRGRLQGLRGRVAHRGEVSVLEQAPGPSQDEDIGHGGRGRWKARCA